jgi:hypothetical protein
LAESGLGAFEAELLRFLTEERAQSFLSNMHGRVAAFLAEKLRHADQPEYQEAFKLALDRLQGLRENSPNSEDQPKPNVADGAENILQLERRAGCLICGAILDAIFAFLSKYQYELTINPEAQQEHASRGGFCPLHTWQYENISSPYGVCMAYPQLAHRIAGELERLSEGAHAANGCLESLTGLAATVATCRVCEVRIEAEKKAVSAAAETARNAIVSNGVHLPACCLPHLAMVAASLGAGRPASNLLRAHARLLERAAEDMQRYALRHGALRRYLTSEEERRASQLVLLLLAGHRSVNAPWTVDSIL